MVLHKTEAKYKNITISTKILVRKGGVNPAPDKIGGGPKGELFTLALCI